MSIDTKISKSYFIWYLLFLGFELFFGHMENVIMRLCEDINMDPMRLSQYLQVELNEVRKWERNPKRIPVHIMQKIGELYSGPLDRLVFGKDPIDISSLSKEDRIKILSFYFKDEGNRRNTRARKPNVHSFEPDLGYLETSYSYRAKDMRANELRISQNEFAYMTGYSRSMIKFWEDGEKCKTLDTILNFCKILRGSLDYFIMDNRPRSLFTGDLDEEFIANIRYNVKRLEKKHQDLYKYS